MSAARCVIRKGLFDRWFIFSAELDRLAWSGSAWVPAKDNGIPTGKFQVCNFESEAEARDYCSEHGLEPVP